MSDILKGKRALVLSVQTFGIQTVILNQLRKQGVEVIFFDERPSNNFLIKGLLRINKSILRAYINAYYRNIYECIKSKELNFVLILRGEVVPKWFLQKVKSSYPKVNLIYYTWDSIENNPSSFEILNLFDKKFSFDHKDCEKYNLELRPLFIPFESLRIKNYTKQQGHFKFSFVGTLHSDRFQIFSELKKYLKEQEIAKGYFYIQNYFVYLYRIYLENAFDRIPTHFRYFKELSIDEIRKIYEDSEFVLDINHPKQTGLTLRTFEVLALGKKLITTNENIKNYRFYNNFIRIIDREEYSNFGNVFENSEERNFNKEFGDFYESLTVEGWVKSILIENEPKSFWIKN